MKRDSDDYIDIAEEAKIIMLDIEGTTTSISFVKEELFPYVRREIESYLKKTWEEAQTKAVVEALIKQIEKDASEGFSGMETVPPAEGAEGTEEVIVSLVKNIHCMMNADRKIGPLKALQGHMWAQAYAEGTLKGHVYEDVIGALKEWQTKGKQIVIYSSGSVQAQKLIFGHSIYGDLLHYFSNHFDTGVGMKVEKDSYLKIMEELNCEPKDLLFVTDLPQEAWAAHSAGIKVVLSIREGTAPLSSKDLATFSTIKSFSQFLLEDTDAPTKKPRI